MSDQTATLNLILQLKAKTDEATEAQKKILAIKDSLLSLSQVSGSIGGAFASGLGIGGALSAIGAIKAVISEAVGAMKELVVAGVDLNKQMETAQFSIAGALRQFLPERFATFSQALAGSGVVIDQLKAKSLELGLSFPDLAHTYQASIGAMFKAGIFDTQKQIDLTATLSRTLASTGVTGARAARDIADLFNGQANRIVALKGLGISNEDITAAKARGDLYDYLQQKLSGYKEAVDAAGDTTERLEQKLSNTKAQVAASETQGLTSAYKDLLKSLNDLASSEAAKDAFAQIVNGATAAVKAVKSVSDALTFNSLDEGKTYQQNAFATIQAADSAKTPQQSAQARSSAVGLRNAAQNSLNDFQSTAGPGALNSDYGKEKIEAYQKVISQMTTLIGAIDQYSDQVVAKNQVVAATAAKQVVDAKRRQAEEDAGALLDKNASKIDVLRQKTELLGISDEDRLATLNEVVAEVNREYDAKAANATGPNQSALVEQDRAKALYQWKVLIAQTETKITAEQTKQSALAGEDAIKAQKINEQDAARLAIQQARGALSDVEATKGQIVSDQYTTRLEKEAQIYALLQGEPALIDAQIAKLTALKAQTGDAGVKQSIDTEINSLGERKKGIPAQSQSVAPKSTGQDIQSNLVGIQNNFATVGQTIAATMNGAVDSVSAGIQSLFDRSKTLGQDIQGIFLGIGQSAVKAVSDMAAQWVIKHTLMAAVTKIFYVQETVAHVASESIKTGATVVGETTRTGATLAHSLVRRGISISETIIHGIQVVIRTVAHIAGEIAKTASSVVNAGIRIETIIGESLAAVIKGAVDTYNAFASIPYVGPFLGAAAMAAYIGTGVALVGSITKNFADGGYASNQPGYVSGAGGPRSDSVPANLSNGEYVLNANAVSQIGKSRLDQVNYTGRLPSVGGGSIAPASNSGGGAQQVTAPQRSIIAPHFIMVDSDQAARRMADTTANEAYVVKIMRKHGAI